jgi:hypothetical protein
MSIESVGNRSGRCNLQPTGRGFAVSLLLAFVLTLALAAHAERLGVGTCRELEMA